MAFENEFKIVGGPHITYKVPVEHDELIKESEIYVEAVNADVELRANFLAAQRRLHQKNERTLLYERDGFGKLLEQVDRQYHHNQLIMQSAPGIEIELFRMTPQSEDPQETLDEE